MPDAVDEPNLAVDDIQGNVLVGFMKDVQTMLCLRIVDVAAAKAWVRELEPKIATTAEVLAYARLRRALKRRRGQNPLGVTWVNVAFSAAGLAKLTSPEEVAAFPSATFRAGMPADAGTLGDPVGSGRPGDPATWLFGGPGAVPDVFLIVASDHEEDLARELEAQKAALAARPGSPEVVFTLEGHARTDRPGHEHFGFKDGISQPAVRGRTPDGDLSPRRLPADGSGRLYAEPGRPLVWPGQFVLGLPQQDHDHPLTPRPAADPKPPWARNGSYLVVRRLRQDVGGFWAFAREQAAALAGTAGFEGMTPERFASLLVGRWPSGAPLMRSPAADDEALGGDDCANNSFFFHGPCEIEPVEGCPPDARPPAPGDPDGALCPYAAHIRKVNPRDDGTDTGGLPDVFTRAILRRGIAYGEPFEDGEDPAAADRGLLFLCYQSSIKEQFGFLTRQWVNQSELPHGEHGLDPILGQAGTDPQRRRWIELVGSNGVSRRVELPQEFVVATGGGYFFAPSLSALRDPIGAGS